MKHLRTAMFTKQLFLLSAMLLSVLFLTQLTGCAASQAIGQWSNDHIASAGGTASVDPQTGAVTIGGTIGFKEREEAIALSTAIQTHNNGGTPPTAILVNNTLTGTVESYPPLIADKNGKVKGSTHTFKVKAVTRQRRGPCGQEKGIFQSFEIGAASVKSNFFSLFECAAPHGNEKPPYIAPVEHPETNFPGFPQPPPASNGDVIDQPDTPATAETPEDAAILAQVEANSIDELPPERGNGDRAVVFGNNYPGTDAELHQCVNDARKNVVNLVKVDKFDPKNIRLFTNKQCTKANYERWVKWALVDGVAALPDPAVNSWGRRAFFNSSHGAEDTDASGKIVQVLVTDDMVRKGVWDASTEVSYDFWYSLLRQTDKPWMILNDSCHSGGQTRIALGLLSRGGRRTRSLDGPAVVQARLERATTQSTAKADLGKLTGTVFAVCLPNELASEGPNGGVGTNAYWSARKSLPTGSKAGDIARECNRLFKTTNESQHFTIVGVNGPLWGN